MQTPKNLRIFADAIEAANTFGVGTAFVASGLRKDADAVESLKSERDQLRRERDQLKRELARLHERRSRYEHALTAISSQPGDIEHLKRWLPLTSHEHIPVDDTEALGDLLVQVADAALRPLIPEEENPVLDHPRQATYQAEVKRYAHSNWFVVYRATATKQHTAPLKANCGPTTVCA
jgi:hypothetical protein